VAELRNCVIIVLARDYCVACWQNLYSDACVFVIVVIDMKMIFLCNNNKVDSFYVFIILIMHRIFKQTGMVKNKREQNWRKLTLVICSEETGTCTLKVTRSKKS